MKTLLLAATAIVALSGAASAADPNVGSAGGTFSGGTSVTALKYRANASAASASSSGSVSGATAGGGAASVSVGQHDVRQAPAIGFGGFASGPCVGAGYQAGVSVSGFGLAGGASTIDEECTRRETARVLMMLGMVEDARRLMLAAPILNQPQQRSEVAPVVIGDASTMRAASPPSYPQGGDR